MMAIKAAMDLEDGCVVRFQTQTWLLAWTSTDWDFARLVALNGLRRLIEIPARSRCLEPADHSQEVGVEKLDVGDTGTPCCGARFDISNLEHADFPCPGCGTILEVGHRGELEIGSK